MWLVIPFMSWMSRVCGGGGWFNPPWGLAQWICALPYLLFYTVIGWWVIPAYLGAVLGLRLGHGRGFNYGIPFEAVSKPERIEALIPEALPVWARKALIMLLTGLAVTIVLAVAVACHGHLLAAVVLAISGAAKALAYLLPTTESAEWVRGGILGAGVVIAFSLLSYLPL